MLIGVFLSFNTFLFPDYFSGEFIHFGKLRPVHVGAVTLLWLLASDIGLLYYIIPRLCGVSIWSYRLASYTSVLYWFSLIVGVFSFPFGGNFGWEYDELPKWVFGILPIKFLFFLSWVLLSINFFMTIIKRKYEKMYVSLWYAMGALIWTSIVVFIGTYVIEWMPYGMSRVNTSFFFVHNLEGLIFTPLGVSVAYYFIPKIANTPLFSHKLSIIGFWTIAFVYAWTGAHHMIHGPASQWLQTTSIVFSIWLIIPVSTVITNFFATMRGNWDQYVDNPSLRFSIMGTVFYTLVCIQGPLQSLRNVNEVTSKTDWIVGHAHMALLGTFTFLSISGIYYVVPILSKRKLYSKTWASWHFTLSLLGAMLMFVSLFIGGFLQGVDWSRWAQGSSYAQLHSQISELSFLQSLAKMRPWWWARALSGVLLLVGNVLFMLNIFNTALLQPKE